MEEKKKHSDMFLKNLAELMGETFSENDKISDVYLSSIGKDPSTIEKEGTEFLERLRGKIRLEIGKDNQSSFQELIIKVNFEGKRLTQSSKERLAELMSGGNPKDYAICFRKLDEIHEDDFRDIQTKLELLKILDKLD